MKKKLLSRICCLALVAVVALGCCTSAFAAQNSMSNFSRVKTYSNQYSDVSSTDWSYGAIKTCYETSLMNGYDDGSFGRRDYLTVAQALVMADRVHQIYTTGANSLTNGTPWYQPYIDYAIEKGIIKAGDFSSYTDYITRADMAYIFSRALPTKELGKLNDIGEIPDVNDAPQRDRDPICLLYFSGVLTGSDVYGTFHPNDKIVREEAAAIISRIAIPAERRQVTLLYKVEEGIVTFGLPQNGFLKSEELNGVKTYRIDGSGINCFVNITPAAEFSNVDITQVSTAELWKSTYEKNGYYNVSVTTVSFGSVKAYCCKTTRSYDGTVLDSVDYVFSGPTGIYDVNVSWATDANRTDVQTILNNVLVNGYAASPAYQLG